MRILITWGSKMGGTEGIARIVADALRDRGHELVARPARDARPGGFDAVIIGGALYANRWHRDARRFIGRHVDALRAVPVWMFSSGPLDDSADRDALEPPSQVAALMARIGALEHVTFGGRLAADTKGFPAQAMTRDHAGDWRNPARIRRWADAIADRLPVAQPGGGIEPPARSAARWLGFALVGWALAAAPAAAMLQGWSLTAAIVMHAVMAPLVFGALSWRYFQPGAREPLPTALGFAVVLAILDLAFVRHHVLTGIALPATLVLFVVWTVGFVRSTLPWPRPPRTSPPSSLATPERRSARSPASSPLRLGGLAPRTSGPGDGSRSSNSRVGCAP